MNTAIVTGASRGLGLALATALVHHGWHVIVDGRDAATLHAATAALGPELEQVAGDVTDPAHRIALVDRARLRGRLDLLVNSASGLGPSPLPRLREYPLDELEALHRVNVVAPLGLVQLALPLIERSRGAVVNVTSDAAVDAYEGWGGYGSTKSALELVGRVLAVEEPNVAVWSFDPGDMRTQMHQEAFPGEDISDRPEPDAVAPAILRLVADRPPSGRVRAADLLAASR
jgi:NAD(P)-dependent dehydrogenase (short-subunit alcohol dehydrogenase family)